MAYTKEETDRFADVNGIRLHYNEAGSGPALICTHGGGPGANAWDNTRHCLEPLAQHFRTILLDLPGFGESAKDVKLGDTPMDFFCAKLMRDLMDQLSIDKAHMYGSSAFSPSSLRFGLEYPDRCGKIVIQAYAPGEHGVQTEGLKSLGVFANDPTRENMERMVQFFTPREDLRPQSFVDARFKAATIPGHLEGRAEMRSTKNSDIAKDIGRLKTQVLVVWGNEDGMIPVEGALDALKLIPNVRACIWGDRSGHFVAYEHPQEFAQLLIGFLEN
ncbi:MAG TPA: alpha/beta hydrolase [Chloroflexota bacterium]|nr:alpha/beta hydrolase [Chloroflexota bacterium]